MEAEDLVKALTSMLTKQTSTADNNKKSRVKVVVNEASGLKVTPYEGNPKLGYVQLEEVIIANSSISWKRRKRKTALMKGEVDVLKEWVNEYKNGILPGKIVVLEFVESEIPDDIAREFFGDPEGERYDELKEGYIKKSGDEGIELTSDGELIYRFQVYDEFDEMEDTTVQHDNSDDVRKDAKLRRIREKEKLQEELELAAKLEADKKAAEKAPETTVVDDAEDAKTQGKLPGA